VTSEWIDQWTPSGVPGQPGANLHLEAIRVDGAGALVPFGC
jgi:hypothetical protein